MPKCAHADLIMEYAKDCQEHEEPWKLWQVFGIGCDGWESLNAPPRWESIYKYRRKPRTVVINGIEVEAGVSVAPDYESRYYFSDVASICLYDSDIWENYEHDLDLLRRGIVYDNPESAAAMGRAMLAFKKI